MAAEKYLVHLSRYCTDLSQWPVVSHRFWFHFWTRPQAAASSIPVHKRDGGCHGRREFSALCQVQKLLLSSVQLAAEICQFNPQLAVPHG
jgi:hypothetical protein